MTTTPPLQVTIQTPSTPLHGAKYDNYQPYVIRKSTRSTTHRIVRTPSPSAVELSSQNRTSSKVRNTSTIPSAAHSYSPPSSTQTSPRKKVQAKARRPSGKVSLGASRQEKQHRPTSVELDLLIDSNTTLAAAMLPTPAKTPRKKVVEASLNPAARVLFPVRPETVEEVMPIPCKTSRKKKHIGFSLDSFGQDDDGSEGKIEIFTDSKDKVPDIDENEGNPFYVKPGQESVSKGDSVGRDSKRRKVSNAINHTEDFEESFKRVDGMIYVFRGKKMFRKFPEEDGDIDTPQDGLVSSLLNEANLEPDVSPRLRPFTRSSMTPRLLFPTAEQSKAREEAAKLAEEEEEAITDIEEPNDLDSEMSDIAVDTEEEILITPVKPSFTPVSPPTTGHATRAATKKAALDSSPLGPEPVEFSRNIVKNGKKISPFAGWQRTKAGSVPNGKGKKREAEATEIRPEKNKRVKSNGS